MELELKSVPGDHERFFTADLGIPDCFNHLVELFLESDCDYAWFVEEDMVVPEGALSSLIGVVDLHGDQTVTHGIGFVDYRTRAGGLCSGYVDNKLVWVGTGCTLIHRQVFIDLPKPYFKTQVALVTRHTGSACKKWVMDLVETERAYGGHDIYFCFHALKRGYRIGIVPGMMCEHLWLDFNRFFQSSLGGTFS